MDATVPSRLLPRVNPPALTPVHKSSLPCHQIGKSMSTCCHSSKSSGQEHTFSCSNPSDKQTGIVWGSSLYGPVQKRNLSGQSFCSLEVCTYPGLESESKSPAHAAEERVGVLLLNLGGPDTLNDVQPFLFNLFADPDIIRLPRLFRFLQRPLAQLISVLRAPKSKEGYASIGGGSPLRKITDDQAIALRNALEAKETPVHVYVAMRYWHPFTEEAVQQIKRDRVTKLVVLPLYPQFSISTTGSSIRVLQNIFREDAYLSRLPVSIIQSWYQREGYIKSMAGLIEKELGSFSRPEEVMIFFSAHGVPVSYVEDAGDPYRDQMEECIHLIMHELKVRGINNEHTLAYQSRVGPVQWLKPYTDEVLVELGEKGVKSLLAVPVSFVSEHIETLEEIDMEYKNLALESGIENWGRVPALGCTSSFITDLADAVIEALPSATAMTSAVDSDENDLDPVAYAIKLFFGSILAFVLLLSPKMISAFRNHLL
ncbi:ferrochelatase-1, chloroplastic [Rhododendron vialii]|uniref:ferrochelatase-1, chloroplastic n=1 Tax=Rhododendron vialii TaxID=182163 RepID=UPI00265E97F4|nr:ferrochelatase-1, chloroplastic [Rhododendron vialii]